MNSVNIDFSIKVEELSFSVRTENCLIADGIRVLGDLVTLSERQLMNLPGFGKKCLYEVNDVLKNNGLSLNMKTEEINKLDETDNYLIALECINTEEAIKNTPYIFDIHNRDIRFMHPELQLIRGLDDKSHGDCLLELLSRKREYEPINIFLDNFDLVMNEYLEMPLEGQLAYILDFLGNIGKDSMRRTAIAERLGFFGNVVTLEEAGEILGVTRERIRQIESTTHRRIRLYLSSERYQAFVPKLDASIRLITAESPIILEDIPIKLKEAGLSELDFSFKAIESVSLIYGRDIDFEIMERRGFKWVVRKSDDPEKYITALKAATAVCQSFGMVQLDSIYEYMTEKMNYDLERKKLSSLFSKSNFVALGEGWYFDPTIGGINSRFLNSLKKMLYCHPSLHVNEIRDGFKRVCARRKLPIAKEWFWPMPPKRIISSYFKHIDDSSQLLREIREIAVETAGIPVKEFSKTFIGNETNLNWIDKYIRAKRKYSSILNRNKSKIIAMQTKLAELSTELHFKINEDEIVSTTKGIELSDLGDYGNENMQIMKSIIEEENSKIIERSDFRKKAEAKGIKLSSFEVEVTYAPWLKQFGHSIWGIRGSDPKAIDIEMKRYQKRSEQRNREKNIHGYDDEGMYFMVSRIQTTVNYVITIPFKYIKNLGQRYLIKDTNGRSYGDIKMTSKKNAFIGLNKALTRVHADIDDIIKLQFNNQTEEVTLEILPEEYYQSE